MHVVAMVDRPVRVRVRVRLCVHMLACMLALPVRMSVLVRMAVATAAAFRLGDQVCGAGGREPGLVHLNVHAVRGAAGVALPQVRLCARITLRHAQP